MTAPVHLHEAPERFVAGTVGEPGSRTFFLQARTGRVLTSVALEKQQVVLLADRIESLIARVPGADRIGEHDNDPLEQPIEEEFRAGTLTLIWDGESDKIIIEAYPVDVEPEEGEEHLEVHLTASMASGFVARSRALVAAGRPPCQFCGGPIDATGHLCPRANGFRRTNP
jgi:uncharacterized repeat protein (TIGR03847 family)